MADSDVTTPAHSDAEKPSESSDAPKSAKDHTGAGQEAARGDLPHGHPNEHQSNYGGGGANGGAVNA